MKEIRMSQGSVAFVDDEDFEWLSAFHWFEHKDKCTSYAIRCGDGRKYSMHRTILNLTGKLVCDHIDGNGMNNQRSNLRICTQSQNAKNKTSHRDSNSRFKGVSRLKNGIFVSYITIDYERKNLGRFRDEEEAARHHNKAAKDLHGEFAKLNQVEPLFPTTERRKLSWLNTSGYFGVKWDKRQQHWIANIDFQRKRHHIGRFTDPVEAAKRYDEMSLKLYGDKAKLNFPDKDV